MPKKPFVRKLMDSQNIKGCERVLESAQQFFCHIFWSLWKTISSENSILVVSEILRLLLNIFTPNHRYSLSKRESDATNSNGIISKSKNICWNFFCIVGICITFGILWKKRWASEMISFWNYRLPKRGLLKCLKSLVSEHLWTVNMLKGPKDCLILHGSIFVIFFDHCETKPAPPILSYYYL